VNRSERVNITKDVGKYVAERGLSEEEALEGGLQEKAREFSDKGLEAYTEI
jgi:phosphomethylpyrimidine synthase